MIYNFGRLVLFLFQNFQVINYQNFRITKSSIFFFLFSKQRKLFKDKIEPYKFVKAKMSIFKKTQNMQKLRYSFETYTHGNKNLIGLKSIKSFFSSIGLYNQLFLNDLFYFYPDLTSSTKADQFQLSFNDCLSFIQFLLSKKTKTKANQDIFQSFKIFDKNCNGIVNANDVLASMKKYLQPKQYDKYSQIITSTFGPTINYLETFKQNNQKHA